MSPSSPPLLPKRKSGLRWWHPSLAIAGILLIVVIIYSQDEAPAKDDDLVYNPLTLHEEENAYFQLTRVAEKLDSLLVLPDSDADLLEEMSNGKNWDEMKATEWLVISAGIWDDYQLAAGIASSQAPIPSSPESKVPEISLIRRLGRLSVIRARHLLREERPDEALNIAYTQLLVGKRIEESRGSIISYLTGGGIKSDALSLIQDISAHPKVSPASLRQAITEIESSRTSKDALAYAFRNELSFYDGAAKILQKGSYDTEETGLWKRTAPRIPLLFKPNKTRRIYTEFLRDASTHIGGDANDLNKFKEKSRGRIERPSIYHPENIIGNIFLNIITPTWSALLRTEMTEQSRLSVHQTAIAIILYQRDHRSLPDSLDNLVPGYLSKLPLDAYSRLPIKYSKELRSLWSVGENNFMISTADQQTPSSANLLVIPELETP